MNSPNFSFAGIAGVELVEPPALLLRAFDYRLRPRYGPGGELEGIYVDLQAKTGLPFQITALFSRSEFVNLATAGLAGLDAADEASGPSAAGSEGPDNPPVDDGPERNEGR